MRSIFNQLDISLGQTILPGALVGKPLVALIPEKSFRFFIMIIALIGAVRLFIK